MCIICVKGRGLVGPRKAVYEHCFTSNPDGAGFMYVTPEGKVAYRKGLMTFEDWWSAFQEVRAGLGSRWRDTEFAAHFRIGTHGSKDNPVHTHPFPLAATFPEMEALSGTVDVAVMHNGIYRLVGIAGNGKRRYKGDAPVSDGEREPSDTMEFTRHVLWPLRDRLGDPDIGRIITTLNEGNRLAVASKDGITLYGAWTEDKTSGMWYSNSGYVPYKSQSTWSGSHGLGYYATHEWVSNMDGYRLRKEYADWERIGDLWFPPMKQSKVSKTSNSTNTKAKATKKTGLPAYRNAFADSVTYREGKLAKTLRGNQGGYDRSRSERMYTWYDPVELVITTKAGPDATALTRYVKIVDPMMAYYLSRDNQFAYRLDPVTDYLWFEGKVASWRVLPEDEYRAARFDTGADTQGALAMASGD